MDYDERDSEVVRLLSKLREAESTYPVDMMVSRRQSYIKQIAALGLGTGAAFALREAAKAAGSSSIPPMATTIVEAALIVAIVVEASVVAFVHRDKVLDVLRTNPGQPTVQHVTAAPKSPLLLDPTEGIETSLIETAVLTVVPETATIIETPSPEMLLVSEEPFEAELNSAEPQMNSTPQPNDNNGNHYGQTPWPERTKDNGNNGGGSNSNDTNNNGNGNNGNNDNNGNGNRHNQRDP